MNEEKSMMSGKETKEIHKTEYIDKDLPTVTYEKVITKSMTEGERIYISVSDKTSRQALATFRALWKEEEGKK